MVCKEPDMSTPNTIFAEAVDNNSQIAASYRLPMLSIGSDRAYVSFFTNQIINETVHYLATSSGRAVRPVRCLGDDCPACRAGLAQHRYCILPVIDRMRSQIALLRLPPHEGTGRLLTEIEEIVKHPNMDELVARITRTGHQCYDIQVLHKGPPDDDQVELVKGFRKRLDNQELNLTPEIKDQSHEQMLEHPHIAAALQFEQFV